MCLKEYFSSSLQSVDSVRDIGLPLHANVFYLNIKSDSKYTLIIVWTKYSSQMKIICSLNTFLATNIFQHFKLIHLANIYQKWSADPKKLITKKGHWSALHYWIWPYFVSGIVLLMRLYRVNLQNSQACVRLG